MVDGVRRRGALALRVLVSAALLGAVLVYADLGEVAAAVRGGHWGWFAAAVVLMVVAVVLGAVRWWLLLEDAQILIPVWSAIRPYAMSVVLNIVLPTAVAGDAIRTWVVGRERGRLLAAAAATVTDKLTALACFFALGWISYAFDRDSVPSSVIVVFAWVTAGLVAALFIAALAAAGVRPILHRLPQRIAVMGVEAWRLLRLWASSPRLVVSVVGLGFAYQVLAVVGMILIGKTLGVELPFALAAVSASIVLVATLIPVSIGGVGIREGGFVLLLGEAGIEAAQATLISLLSAAVVLLAGALVAGVTYVSELVRPGAAKTSPAP